MKYLILLISCFSSYISFSQNSSANLIRNGDFEEGNNYFISEYTYHSSSVNPGDYSVVTDASKLNTFFKLNTHSTYGKGQYLVVDASHEEGRKFWCSKVKVKPNADYIFSLAAVNIHVSAIKPPEIALAVNGNELLETHIIRDSTWKQFSWKWKSPSTIDSAEVCLLNINAIAEGSDLAVDDISFIEQIKVERVEKKPCPYLGDTLKNLVHFPFNEFELTRYSSTKLYKLLSILAECPELKVKILSHADIYGSDGYNDKLSEKRSESVREFLINKGISPSRISVQAFGEKKPVYTGATFKKHIKNRRVDFVLF